MRAFSSSRFQSTLPVWGATSRPGNCKLIFRISIHAPRVGSDKQARINERVAEISIHAPRVGSDAKEREAVRKTTEFQSKLPLWGATPSVYGKGTALSFQSTLPVWGATYCILYSAMVLYISIHAPRVGSDHKCRAFPSRQPGFQSTLPVWGATGQPYTPSDSQVISIHAPRVGSDSTVSSTLTHSPDFNPRSPCGERRSPPGKPSIPHLFQSTLPVWGATAIDIFNTSH